MDLLKKKYLDQLYDNRIMETDEEFALFENALDGLISTITLNDIPDLYKAFDDKTRENEVMFRLVHVVEQFDEQDSMDLTIQGMLESIDSAENWMKILIRRILNSDKSKEQFGLSIKNLDSVSIIKLQNLLQEIKHENPEWFSSIVEETPNGRISLCRKNHI